MSAETVSIPDCECIVTTPRALKVKLPDREEHVWVPASLVDDDSEVWSVNDKGTLVVPEWWAIDKGLV